MSDLVLGKITRTVVYSLAITAVVLHPAEQLFFCGSVDGRIFINNLDFDDQVVELQGHK